MKKTLLFLSLFIFLETRAESAWIWTPESGRWINPKYSLKDTPQEQYEWAMRLLDLGEYNQAVKRFRQLIKRFPQSPYAPKSQLGIGLAYEKAGKIEKAVEEYQKMAETYPYSPDISEVIEAEYRLGDMLLNREGGDVWQKIATYEGNYERAARIFEQAIKISPFNPRAPEMQYKSGEAYLKAKKYEEAAAQYKKVLDNYKESEWVAEATFKLGLCAEAQSLDTLRDQAKTEEAIQWFSEYLKKYPGGDKTKEVKERLAILLDKKARKIYECGEYYQKDGDKESALIYYRRLLRDFPETAWAAKAREKLNELK